MSYQLKMGSKRGFTLTKFVIALVIVGLLIGFGTGLIDSLLKKLKVLEAKAVTNAAVKSVISYAVRSDKLPDTATLPATKGNPYYIYDSDLATYSKGGLCGKKTTNITVRICPDAGCTSPANIIKNVAFIILNGDEKHNAQTAGMQALTTPTTINFYKMSVDDMISKWATIDEMRKNIMKIKSSCAYARFGIVNRRLPYGFIDSAYNATVYAYGGTGKYRWCRQENLSTGLTFTPSTLSTDCLNLSESSWGSADNLTISGTPTESGSYSLAIFVRDNNDTSIGNDNITQKRFVIKIYDFSL